MLESAPQQDEKEDCTLMKMLNTAPKSSVNVDENSPRDILNRIDDIIERNAEITEMAPGQGYVAAKNDDYYLGKQEKIKSTQVARFHCEQQGCEESYSLKSHLKLHVRDKHAMWREFVCDFPGCEASFKLKELLKEHSRRHKRVAPDAPMSDLNTRIMQLVGNQYESDINDGTVNDPPKEEIITASMDDFLDASCGEGSSNQYSNQPEISPIVIKVEREEQEEDVGKRTCDICGLVVKHFGDLMRHKRTHSGAPFEFLCDVCPKSYSRKDTLLAHMAGHTVSFECEDCNLGFGLKHVYIRHMQTVHMNGNHQCDNCDKKFSRNDSLLRHKKVCN